MEFTPLTVMVRLERMVVPSQRGTWSPAGIGGIMKFTWFNPLLKPTDKSGFTIRETLGVGREPGAFGR